MSPELENFYKEKILMLKKIIKEKNMGENEFNKIKDEVIKEMNLTGFMNYHLNKKIEELSSEIFPKEKSSKDEDYKKSIKNLFLEVNILKERLKYLECLVNNSFYEIYNHFLDRG